MTSREFIQSNRLSSHAVLDKEHRRDSEDFVRIPLRFSAVESVSEELAIAMFRMPAGRRQGVKGKYILNGDASSVLADEGVAVLKKRSARERTQRRNRNESRTYANSTAVGRKGEFSLGIFP